jgi:hypothetical protein
MTGRLQEKVIVHPFFPGKTEQVLLRAQIQRISADTVLCPKGFMVLEDPEAEQEEPILAPRPVKVQEKEEFFMPGPAELAKVDGWIHQLPHILGNGRTALEQIPDPEDDNPELDEKIKRLTEEKDTMPILDIHRSVAADAPGWVVKQTGDDAFYKYMKAPTSEEVPKERQTPSCNIVTCVRSLKWPGAICVSQGTRFTNYYVGYGLPSDEPAFFPKEPMDIQDEPEDQEEFPEPTGPQETADAPPDE